MIIEKLSRVIYEVDRSAIFKLAGKSLDEILDAYKIANEDTRNEIMEHVDKSIQEKLIAMEEGGLYENIKKRT